MAAISKSGTPSLSTAIPPTTNSLSGLYAGEAIAAGDACYIKTSDGKVYRSIGTAANATNGIDQYQLLPAVNDRFSFSFQREVWRHFILDFEYFYNHETNLPFSVDINMVDPAFSYETPKSVFNLSEIGRAHV